MNKDIERGSPDQPRDPKGESTGGQWTSGGSSAGSGKGKSDKKDNPNHTEKSKEYVKKALAAYELDGDEEKAATKALTSEWNKLSENEKSAASEEIMAKLIP